MDRRYKKRMDRYWLQMRKDALDSLAQLEASGWFDFWHCHIDFEGKADQRLENRPAAIALGYEILRAAEQFVLGVNGPVQIWWCVHPKSSADAVYLHSPNENNSAFPYAFAGVEWGGPGCEDLFRLVDRNSYQIGVLDRACGLIYFVRPVGSL